MKGVGFRGGVSGWGVFGVGLDVGFKVLFFNCLSRRFREVMEI